MINGEWMRKSSNKSENAEMLQRERQMFSQQMVRLFVLALVVSQLISPSPACIGSQRGLRRCPAGQRRRSDRQESELDGTDRGRSEGITEREGRRWRPSTRGVFGWQTHIRVLFPLRNGFTPAFVLFSGPDAPQYHPFMDTMYLSLQFHCVQAR